MFIQKGDHKIWLSFNNGLSVKVEGDNNYLLEWFEYLPNSDRPHLLYHVILNGAKEHFDPRRWYGKHKICISRWDKDQGIVQIYSHTYDDFAKDVFFRIDSDGIIETESWLNEVREYIKKSRCLPHISTNFNKELSLPEVQEGTEYYSSFYIGRYFQETNGDVEQYWGEISHGLFRRYWSHYNPRNWESITHRQVARDILGLTEWEDGILFTTEYMKRNNPKYIK